MKELFFFFGHPRIYIFDSGHKLMKIEKDNDDYDNNWVVEICKIIVIVKTVSSHPIRFVFG